MLIISQRINKKNKWNTYKSNQNHTIIGKFKSESNVFLSPISYANRSKKVFNEQKLLLALIEKKEPNDYSIVAHPLRRHV